MPPGLNTDKAYSEADDAYQVRSVQAKFRDSFTGAVVDPNLWRQEVGAGASISQAAGTLVMASGTTANSESWLLSAQTFTIPCRLGIGLTLSQRIANQTFWVELVSVNPATLMPDGRHCAAIRFDGTTATQAVYEVQNGGLARLASTAVTMPTTAAAGMYEIEVFADESWFHGQTIDSTTARSNSYRRHQQIPDPNQIYKVRLRWLNGATPPASSTNATAQYLMVMDYMELTAEITAGRGQTVAGQAIGVHVSNNPTLAALPAGTALIGDVGQQYRANATGAASRAHFVAAATTNAANIKATAGRVLGWYLSNMTASWRFVKFHNSATAPTAGAGVFLTVGIPPNGVAKIALEGGIAFSAGIGITCVTGAADADATATGATDVVGDIFFA
jgi:hypothetical protein